MNPSLRRSMVMVVVVGLAGCSESAPKRRPGTADAGLSMTMVKRDAAAGADTATTTFLPDAAGASPKLDAAVADAATPPDAAVTADAAAMPAPDAGPDGPPPDPFPTTPMPSGWTTTGVGAGAALAGSGFFPGAPDRATDPAGKFHLKSAGGDIEGMADSFTFAYQQFTGDGVIVARVGWLEQLGDWSKAGLMFREDLEPGSPNAAALVPAGLQRVRAQFRETKDAPTRLAEAMMKRPMSAVWLRLERVGNTFTASYALTDKAPGTTDWVSLFTRVVTMKPEALVGLVVSANNPATAVEPKRAYAEFTAVHLTNVAAPWVSRDILTVGGSTHATVPRTGPARLIVKSSGKRLESNSDADSFTLLSGPPFPMPGEVVTRVRLEGATHAKARAGVLVRVVEADNEWKGQFVFVGVDAAGAPLMLWRPYFGNRAGVVRAEVGDAGAIDAGSALDAGADAGATNGAPTLWVRLRANVDGTFSGFFSRSTAMPGANEWLPIATTTASHSIGLTAVVGVGAVSGSDADTATATFDLTMR